MTVDANWDGHQHDPTVALSLPERIVHAVEAAIQGAATDVHQYRHGDWVGGYAVDMARVAGAAVIDVLAEELRRKVCCCGSPCSECVGLVNEIRASRELAQSVRDVPAVV